MNIPSNFIRESSKLFAGMRLSRFTLPVLSHILATLDGNTITLAATDLDRWLETRTDLPVGSNESESFLIPQDALKAMKQADRNSMIRVSCRGPRKRRELRLAMTCGGIPVESTHPTLDASEFTASPAVEGRETLLPGKTLESLAVIAGCASNDMTRYVLNGVLFTPDDGGKLVATDGRRLGIAPAVVPPLPFILPNQTVDVLVHPGFAGNEVKVRMWKMDETEWISIRSGHHHLVSKCIEGNFPNFKQVIPAFTPELATFSPENRAAVIKWLRGLTDHEASIHLSWERKRQLTLTQRSSSDAAAVLRVPVEIEGRPPLIAFPPHHLADALEIGGTLCLTDEVSPGVCRNPNGRFCVVMPMRVTIDTSKAVQAAAA